MEETQHKTDAAALRPSEISRLQEERLSKLLLYAYENIPFYRDKFERAGIRPEGLLRLSDLRKLPLLSLEEILSAPFERRVGVRPEEIAEVESVLLGGHIQFFPATERDLEGDLVLLSRFASLIGLREGDRVQVLAPWGLLSLALRRIGACVILSVDRERETPDFQLQVAKQMKPTAILASSAQLLRFINRAKALGIDLRRDTSLNIAIALGEPLSCSLRARIEEETGLRLYMIYGPAEIPFRSPVAGECTRREGMHIWGDYYIPEVIDPETQEVLRPGEEGELVLTTLAREAFPLIRFRTGDMAKLLDPKKICSCGCAHPRIGPIRGKVAHILKVGGRRILPIDIEEVISGIPGLGSEYRVIIEQKGELERLRLRIEHSPEVIDVHKLQWDVERELKHRLSVECSVELVPEGTIPQTFSRAQRLIRAYEKEGNRA